MRMNKTLSYLNRELSWIEFNNRVLLEAQKESVPLLKISLDCKLKLR